MFIPIFTYFSFIIFLETQPGSREYLGRALVIGNCCVPFALYPFFVLSDVDLVIFARIRIQLESVIESPHNKIVISSHNTYMFEEHSIKYFWEGFFEY